MDGGLCVYATPKNLLLLLSFRLSRAEIVPADSVSRELITSQHVLMGESRLSAVNQYASLPLMQF